MKVLLIVCLLSATAYGALLGGLEDGHHEHHDHHHDFPLATGREAAEASVRLLEFFNAVEDEAVQFPVDMPTYNALPTDIRFTCADKLPGYYADVDYGCQVYHMCRDDPEHNTATFLCPNATIFHQQIFSCDWWFNVDCASSPDFYYLNENIYKDPVVEETAIDDFRQFDSRPVRSAALSALQSQQQEFVIVVPEAATESKGRNSIRNGYVPPIDDYLPPRKDYLPPTEGYLPPKEGYLPPKEGYLPPKKEYLPPN